MQYYLLFIERHIFGFLEIDKHKSTYSLHNQIYCLSLSYAVTLYIGTSLIVIQNYVTVPTSLIH